MIVAGSLVAYLLLYFGLLVVYISTLFYMARKADQKPSNMIFDEQGVLVS